MGVLALALALGLATACTAAKEGDEDEYGEAPDDFELDGALPIVLCEGDSDAHANLNAFWFAFESEYGLFDMRLPDGDWHALGLEACAQIGDGQSVDDNALSHAVLVCDTSGDAEQPRTQRHRRVVVGEAPMHHDEDVLRRVVDRVLGDAEVAERTPHEIVMALEHRREVPTLLAQWMGRRHHRRRGAFPGAPRFRQGNLTSTTADSAPATRVAVNRVPPSRTANRGRTSTPSTVPRAPIATRGCSGHSTSG